MLEQEKQFERLVPMRSVLGREYLRLFYERNKQQAAFESSTNKMACDTLPLRRANLALEKFLDMMLPHVMSAHMRLEDSRERLEIAEAKAQNDTRGIKLDRRSMQIIWTRFAIERYRLAIPKADRKKFRAYHPLLWKELGDTWREFRQQIKRWQFGGQPFDGSQAMHSMIAFQVKAHLLGAAND